jgi:hypothetical protein
VGGWSRHACRVSPTKCGTESSRYVNATDTSADFRDAPIQPGVPSVPRCAVNPGRKLSGRRRHACVLASVRRPNCPHTFRVILGFCGCNLRPRCFRIRRTASTAARCLCCRFTAGHPIIGETRQLESSQPHLPIKRRQQNVAGVCETKPPLRSAALAGKELPSAVASCLEPCQAKHSLRV